MTRMSAPTRSPYFTSIISPTTSSSACKFTFSPFRTTRANCNGKGKNVVFIQRSIQSVGPLKALYTSPPGRPVHSDTDSTSLESILATMQLRAKTIHSHFHHRLFIYTGEWTEASWRERKCPNFETVAKWVFEPGLI